jgi:hypothetical protein
MSEPIYAMLSYHQLAHLRLADDRYGIYAQRLALSKVLRGGCRVYRGTEWWH